MCSFLRTFLPNIELLCIGFSDVRLIRKSQQSQYLILKHFVKKLRQFHDQDTKKHGFHDLGTPSDIKVFTLTLFVPYLPFFLSNRLSQAISFS